MLSGMNPPHAAERWQPMTLPSSDNELKNLCFSSVPSNCYYEADTGMVLSFQTLFDMLKDLWTLVKSHIACIQEICRKKKTNGLPAHCSKTNDHC